MSGAGRRTTRSSSRALSEASDPAEAADSVYSAKSDKRRKRKSDKPTVTIAKETYSYGTEIAGTSSQRLAAQAAMMKPVRGIETGVEQAARDAAEEDARDLSDIAEEAQGGRGTVGRNQVGGDLRGNRGNGSDSELTGIKSFGREDGDSLNRQSRLQSRAPSIDRDLFEQNYNHYSARDSTWDSIRGSLSGIFKSTGWLVLLILYIVATAISFFFIARWYPIMNNLEGSGYNFSSLATSGGSPLVTLEIERLGRRLEIFEDQLQKLPRMSETAARPIQRQINYLSYDLGARAIPDLSSPSLFFQKGRAKRAPVPTRRTPRWWEFWRARCESDGTVEGEATPLVKFERIEYGPNAALQPWREHEPRYCVPGKLQLAVKLPRVITPLDIVMEHYLKDEVLWVGTGPKEVELWIPILDDVTRSRINLEVIQFYPDIWAREESEDDRLQEQRRALDSNWIPVGRWTYNIYANEIAQRFRIPVDLELYRVAVDQIAIRVNSNWAVKDNLVTCMVRARMHGIDHGSFHNLHPRGD